MDDRPVLQSEAAVGEAMRGVVRHILAEAHAAIDDPAKPDAEAVHDFRRAMKRWRAFLRLLGSFAGEEAKGLRDEARDLARGLSGARDAQAALDALADLEKHGIALSARSIAGLRQRLNGIRRAAETSLDAHMRERLGNAIDRADTIVARWPLQMLSFDEVATELARSYRAARCLIPPDWSAAGAEELHELRKRVVTHRYQMDIVEPLWPRFVRMWTGEAQRLRERLGKHQDALMLESLTGPHRPLARWRSQIVPALAERKASHVAGAARIAGRLFIEKPSAVRRRLAGMWAQA